MTQPFRIAHILPFPAVGGTETATLRIIRNLPESSFHHCAFHLDGAPAIQEWLRSGGVDCHSYAPVQPSYHRPTSFVRFSRDLARQFRSARVDLVHCADVLAAHYCFLGVKLAGLPMVCHVRNPYPDISLRDRTFLRCVNRFIFVARDSWFRFALRVKHPRGRVIYDTYEFAEVDVPADNPSVRRELGIPEKCRIVGMVARVAPQKDHETLVRAARRVLSVAPATMFLIVGDNRETPVTQAHFERLQNVLAEAGVAQHFIFTGFRPDASRLTAAMDVVALSTHTEGLPLVLAEAMALGKPVVATAVGGVPEIVSHGQTGLLCHEADVMGLATQLLSVLTDEALARRLGEAARESVKARFGKERFVKELEAVYYELLSPCRNLEV